MRLIDTSIEGLFVVEAEPLRDSRGLFERLYCQNEFANWGLDKAIVQINHSITRSTGAVRGMHFQHPPFAEVKMVRCLAGAVFDVAVDLRKGSATFLQWHAVVLSPNRYNLFVIPEGFAHGFQVLEPNGELLYCHTAFYNQDAEGGVRYDDPRINIQWPVEVTHLSERDRGFAYLSTDFEGLPC